MPLKPRKEKTPAASTAGVSSAQNIFTKERTEPMNSIVQPLGALPSLEGCAGALTECVTETLTDAESAHVSMGALVELLRGCPADYPLSAGLFLGLVVSVKAHLDNVVDGLRVANRNTLAH